MFTNLCTLQAFIEVQMDLLDYAFPESEQGDRSEGYREAYARFLKDVRPLFNASVKASDGEVCYVLAIGVDNLYLDASGEEWLGIIYARPSEGLTPSSWYHGYWKPQGITIL